MTDFIQQALFALIFTGFAAVAVIALTWTLEHIVYPFIKGCVYAGMVACIGCFYLCVGAMYATVFVVFPVYTVFKLITL